VSDVAPAPPKLPRRKLMEACLGLKAGLNAALQHAGLPQFTDVVDADQVMADEAELLLLPLLVVSLDGLRHRKLLPGRVVEERLTVHFAAHLECPELVALAVEDVVFAYLRDHFQTLKAQVAPDAVLLNWLPLDNKLADHPELLEAVAWLLSLPMEAVIQW